MRKLKTKDITTIGILSALSVVLGLTPIGMLPVGVIRITTLHIPTIIAAVVGGPIVGGIVGLIFGIFSMVQNIMAPVAISFIFWNPIVSILPRFLIGFLCGHIYNFLKNKNIKNIFAFGITGAIGALINTTGVLGLGYLLFKNRLFETFHIDPKIFMGTIAITNGPAEMIASAFIVIALGSALVSTNIISKNKSKNKNSLKSM